jgi:hypothetical protein
MSPADLGIGGILGSGLIAFLLIPAISTTFAPGGKLVLKKDALARDIFFYV